MALVEGTNCGFLSERPSGDPDTGTRVIDGSSVAGKFEVPADAGTVTEIGFYHVGAVSTNYEVGLYEHNSGSDIPAAAVSGSIQVGQSTGTSSVWVYYTGLSIDVSAYAGGILWIAAQKDSHAGSAYVRVAGSAGGKHVYVASQTALADPFPTASSASANAAFYVLYEAAGGGIAIPVFMNQYRQRRS